MTNPPIDKQGRIHRLTGRQKKFVQLYDGNATSTARKAGYSKRTASRAGYTSIKNPAVIKAIEERNQKTLNPLIADRRERQEFWTMAMRNQIPGVSINIEQRLRASELLGKSEADFTEKVLHDVTESLAEAIGQARTRVSAKD